MRNRNQRGSIAGNILLGILVIIAFIIVLGITGAIDLGWQATHDRKEQDIQSENKRHGYENQTSLRDTATAKITESTTVDPSSPHGIALRNEICALYSQMDGDISQNIMDYARVNCV